MKKTRLFLFVLPVVIFFALATPFWAFGQAKITLTINPGIPGVSTADAGPVDIVVALYKYALLISGILAFGAIVWGGVQYTMAAGNPSMEEEGKHWIEGAFYGLILLAGAYVILRTINPDIVGNLGLPGLPGVSIVSLPPPPSGGVGTGGTGGAPGVAGGATCPLTTSGPCSEANLQNTCMGSNAKVASGICRAESGGIPNVGSGQDKCLSPSGSPVPVSLGLFQINLTQHPMKNSAGQTLNCPSAFDKPLTGCVINGSCPPCHITNQDLFNQCVQAAVNPTTNIQAACQISGNGTNWSQWSTHTKCGV